MQLRRCLVLFALCGAVASEDDVAAKYEKLLNQVEELQVQQLSFEAELQNRIHDLEGQSSRRLTDSNSTDYDSQAAVEDLKGAMNHMWLILCGALVFLMQAGFCMLEAGCCRAKNVQNIMLKNLIDVCLGTICWYVVGWMFAYGFKDEDHSQFAGSKEAFGSGFLIADDNGIQTPTDKPLNWFFQWAFCSAATTIVSGGVAERINFRVYMLFTIVMTTVIYPCIVGSTWSGKGWLGTVNNVGFFDFAGSGIVHMTGGVGALVGAIVVGPRKGRFDGSTPESTFDPHSLPLVVLGTFILWFGWYGFNCGSTLAMDSTNTGRLAAVVAMNTTLAASAGGLVVLTFRRFVNKKYDIGAMCNGVLAGLVSITAGCSNVESGSALLIGALGGLIYCGASGLLRKIMVDDPIDAFAVHGACGAWGVLAAALFDWGKGMNFYNGANGFTCVPAVEGQATPCMESAWMEGFAANLLQILFICAWAGGISALFFLPMRFLGMLRMSDEMQDMGADAAKHSQDKAYATNAVLGL
jgi:Amt family ammonium transporter